MRRNQEVSQQRVDDAPVYQTLLIVCHAFCAGRFHNSAVTDEAPERAALVGGRSPLNRGQTDECDEEAL